MDKYAHLLDSFWCLIFGMTSMGGLLWIYWDVALTAQNFL